MNLRFQRLPKSKTPILMSVHQLGELDRILYIKERKADFKAIKKYGVPLNKTEKGHLTISLKDWPKQNTTKKEPTITTEEIDIWNAEVQEINRGILRRKQRTQIENWEKELQEKLDKCQQIVDSMKADPEEKRPLLCELYAGGMAATWEAQQRTSSYEAKGHPYRGRIFEQQEAT